MANIYKNKEWYKKLKKIRKREIVRIIAAETGYRIVDVTAIIDGLISVFQRAVANEIPISIYGLLVMYMQTYKGKKYDAIRNRYNDGVVSKRIVIRLADTLKEYNCSKTRQRIAEEEGLVKDANVVVE